MVPKINNQGHSFKGLIAYLMHDQESQETSERVRWYETGNMITDDPEKAAKVMAWTDMHSKELKAQSGGSNVGRKVETGSVYHFSLAWHGEETPDAKHQHEYALKNIKKLNLQDHEYVLVAHNDTDHDHVHIVVNLTHPETGKRAELKYSKEKVQDLALQYEKEHGIYCEQRFKNEREREKARLTHQVTRAYELSDNGKSFKSALEAEGLTLAAGRNNKRIVFIDEKGQIQSVARFLKTDEKSPTKALRNRFADLDINTLPEAGRRADEIKAKNEQLNRKSEEVKRDFKEAAKEQPPTSAQNQQATRQKSLNAEAEKRRKEENVERYIKRVQEKAAQSREKWNIDALARARDGAKAAHEKGQGRRTGAALKKAENALKEGQEQFRSDLLGINKNRPKWAIGKELKEQGLSPVVTDKELQYMRKVEAAQKEQRAAAALKAKYFDALFEKRAAQRREKWAIDELTKEREEARRTVDKLKVFNTGDKAGRVMAAAQEFKTAEKTLNNHLVWFRNDVVLLNWNRPEWVVERELKKQGLPTDDLKTAITEAKERAEQLREKREAYHRGKAEFVQRERERALNRQIKMQMEKSRKHWEIDKAIADKEAAQEAYKQVNKMRDVLMGRKRQAAENLEVATRTHQDRMHHFKNEILWFNRIKPKEDVREVLRAQGLERDYSLPRRDMRTPAQMEADAIRQKAEKKRQREAEKQAKAKQRLLEKHRKKDEGKRKTNQIVEAAYNGDSAPTKAVPLEAPTEQIQRTPVSLKKPEQPKTEFKRAVGKKKIEFDFTGKANALGRMPPQKAAIEQDTQEVRAPIRARSVMAQATERKKERVQAQSLTVPSPQLSQGKAPEVTKQIRVKSALAQVAERKQEKTIERTGSSLEQAFEKGQNIDNGLEL